MPVTMSCMSLAKRVNLLKSGANLIYRRLRPWSMPLHMQFELTNFCNLNCPVCPTGIKAVKRPPRAMDVELIEHLIDEVGPYLLTLSLWGWGEPLLHPHLQSILKTVRKYRITTLLSTNGQNLDDEQVIEALTREAPTYLIFAIDGLTDETNARFRKGAKLSPILAGVQHIAQIKEKMGLYLPVLHMRYIVMKHNQHEIPNVIDFARCNHFDLLTIRTLLIIDAEASARVHDELVPDIENLRAYHYKNNRRLERRDFICQQPFWFPTVFADGTLVACEQDYNAQQSLGVISKDVSFAEVWGSKRASAVRRIIRETPRHLSFCQNCPYRDRETTDCSVQAHFLNPRINYPCLV
jgi:radical SAM protein with 4Fe4S-binding SPASM domain